jgi:hypothetical protein
VPSWRALSRRRRQERELLRIVVQACDTRAMDDQERAQAVALLQRARDLCVRQMWAAANKNAAGAVGLQRLLQHLDAAIGELDELGFSIPVRPRKP